jgi:hypothetical protein
MQARSGRPRQATTSAIAATLASVAMMMPGAVGSSFAASYVPGSVTIDGGAAATRFANTTLTLGPPSDAADRVRLSNDGLTWIESDWAPSIPWSLTDPAAGGVPGDGTKTVVVEYGDGTDWSTSATDSIIYDTTPPTVPAPGFLIDGGAATSLDWVVDANSGLYDAGGFSVDSSRRVSLDGIHWSSWGPQSGPTRLRDIDLGGTWDVGVRTVWAQYRDLAGNVSGLYSDDIIVADVPDDPGLGGPVHVRFDFPTSAITGQSFTIEPIYPDGFVMPTTARCLWQLQWGDDEAIDVQPNETFGEIVFYRTASRGGCGKWTFTLPYTSALRYRFTFQMEKDPRDAEFGSGTSLYRGPQADFHAQLGSTDPAMHQSNIPVAYLLPVSTMSQTGDPTTYRLYATDATAPPQTGTFWAYTLACYINPQLQQVGGTTFTYRPPCSGSWTTGWTGTYRGGYMRSQYDPIVDGRAPTVSKPVIRLRSGAGFGTSAPGYITWSARDSGSGVWGYQVQISRNGGSYAAITLSSRRATSVNRALSLTGTYRVRVRARDRVGNWSGWVYGSTTSARILQDGSAAVSYSAGWARLSSTTWSGGTARMASVAGNSATVLFTGRGIAWVTGRAPNRGIAQIRVDGVLVATVDLRAASVSARLTAYSKTWSAVGKHKLSIRILGTIGRPSVVVDAFLILR